MMRVCPLDDLWIGEMRGLAFGRRKVVVVHTTQGVQAFHDRCPHLGLALSEGHLDGDVLTCRAHRWEYDCGTGRGLNPCSVRLDPIPVRIEGGTIFVELDAVAP